MAKKFLTSIDLNKNELQNAVIQNLGSAPGSPVEGQIYTDTTDDHLYWYSDVAWCRLDNLTAAEALTQIKTVDGAASGLDADLLDGQHGSYYLDRANHSGTQLASTISDFDTQVQTNSIDELADAAADVSMGGFKITSLATPVADDDAVTKAYVDSLVQGGADWKNSVRAATTTNGTLATAFDDGSVIDGVTLATGDRILIKDQTAGEENGLYVVEASGAPTRATDADVDAEVSGGLSVWVDEGTANGNSAWTLTNDGIVDVGTDSWVFVQFSGLGQITAGNGLTKTGNTIDVVGTADRITANANSIDIAATYAGQTSIVTLGTITTGVWNGTDIAVADGGTGASSAAGAKTNLGFTTKYSGTIGDNSATSFNITQGVHGLATNAQMIVQVLDASSGAEVIPDISLNNSNGTVTIAFAVAPTTDQYRVNIIG